MWFIAKPSRLEDVMPGWINVANRGIIGDGRTDVTSALASLLQEAQYSGNRTLYFPPGTYIISGDIVIPENVRIVGAGQENVVLQQGKSPARLVIGSYRGSISNLVLSKVAILVKASPPYDASEVLIEDVEFIGNIASDFIQIVGEVGRPTSIEGGITVRRCVFILYTLYGVYAINARDYQSTINIEDCYFYVDSSSGIPSVISLYRSILRADRIYWEPWDHPHTFIKVESATAYLGTVNIMNRSSSTSGIALANIIDNQSTVILDQLRKLFGQTSIQTVTGYKERLINLSDQLYVVRNPDGAVLSLPTQRSTTSTDYVTLKKFTSNVVGKIRTKARIGNDGQGGQIFVRFLKNGVQVYEYTCTVDDIWTAEVDIPVTIGDVIEYQMRLVSGSIAKLYEVVVYHIPYRANDFTNVVD